MRVRVRANRTEETALPRNCLHYHQRKLHPLQKASECHRHYRFPHSSQKRVSERFVSYGTCYNSRIDLGQKKKLPNRNMVRVRVEVDERLTADKVPGFWCLINPSFRYGVWLSSSAPLLVTLSIYTTHLYYISKK